MAGIVYNNLYFYGGVYASAFLNGERKCLKGKECTNYSGIYKNTLSLIDTGYILGFGYKINKYSVDLRYSRGFIQDESDDSYYDPEIHSDINYFYQFIFTVAYTF